MPQMQEEGISMADAKEKLLNEVRKKPYSPLNSEISESLDLVFDAELIAPGQCKILYNESHSLIKEFYNSPDYGDDFIVDILDTLFFYWGQLNGIKYGKSS